VQRSVKASQVNRCAGVAALHIESGLPSAKRGFAAFRAERLCLSVKRFYFQAAPEAEPQEFWRS